MTSTTVISYPIPIYQNLPIHAEYYRPSVVVIANIQLGITTVVIAASAPLFVIGQEVRLIIPSNFGCEQINGKTGFIVEFLTTTRMRISIDSSRNVTPYNTSAVATIQNPQIVAIGDVNTGARNANGLSNQITFINGSFRNISPQ